VVPFLDPRPTVDIPLLETDPIADPALATAKRHVLDPDTGTRAELDFLYVVYGTTEDDGPEDPVSNRLNYRVASFVDDPSDPASFKEDIFAPAQRLDLISDTAGVRRQVDYRTIRTQRTPVVAGRRSGMLDVFVVGLQSNPHEPYDGHIPESSTGANRIRHVTLRVETDGSLSWDSERPVLLMETDVMGAAGAAGGAVYTDLRNKLRWFYPDGRQLQVRTRH
jgi:hypothetical protein